MRLRALIPGLLLLLMGCASIPTSGPVESLPVTVPPRGIEIAPEPPQPGISPGRLIDGFLQAMADPEADYAVARQYLTLAAGKAWDPSVGASIYEGAVTGDGSAFSLRGGRTGVLDANGRFTAANEAITVDLDVVEEDGEWRIAHVPDGVLVSRFMFDRYYSHATVYFMGAAGDLVIPDIIHVPEPLLTPTRIVQSQIAGPSTAVAGVVRNALPSGVVLGGAGATVDQNGIAVVSFRNLPDSMSEELRRQLGAQLLWSLTAIPRVTGLRVIGDGGPLELPGQDAEGVLELASQQGYQALSRAATPDLFGVRDGVAGRVGTAGSFIAMGSDGVRVSEVAASLDVALVAFIDENRRVVLVGPLGGQLTQVVPDLLEIRDAQFASGQLWVLGDDPKGRVRLLRIDSQGGQTFVETDALPGTIERFAIAQTGTRGAFVVNVAGEPHLVMATLGVSSGPVVMGSWPLLLMDESAEELHGITDISWSSETELAVLAGAVEAPSVYLVQMDGSAVEHLGPVPVVPTQITALPRMGGDAVVVRSADGVVIRYEARTRWSPLDLALSQVNYPG